MGAGLVGEATRVVVLEKAGDRSPSIVFLLSTETNVGLGCSIVFRSPPEGEKGFFLREVANPPLHHINQNPTVISSERLQAKIRIW